jgi:hypothetical protein
VKEAEAVAAGGRSSAISLARSYLSFPRQWVALLLDADTSDPVQVREERDILNSSLATFGGDRRYGVFLAVPAIESALFNPQVARAAFGRKLGRLAMVRGKFEPQNMLVDLAPKGARVDYALIIKRLLSRPRVGQALAECSPFDELLKFVNDAASLDSVAGDLVANDDSNSSV